MPKKPVIVKDHDRFPVRPCRRNCWQVEQILCRALDINYLGHRSPAEDALVQGLTRLFGETEGPVGADLERAGQPWQHVYIVERGVLKLHQQGADGRTCIHHFFTEGDIVWPAVQAGRSAHNPFSLGVVRRCRLARAPFAAVRECLRLAGRWDDFALVLNEQLAEQALEREAGRRFHNAMELYRAFLADHGDLLGVVPDCQLAQWIGISPETFSRLKKQAS